jgi:hypothetical protein
VIRAGAGHTNTVLFLAMIALRKQFRSPVLRISPAA